MPPRDGGRKKERSKDFFIINQKNNYLYYIINRNIKKINFGLNKIKYVIYWLE